MTPTQHQDSGLPTHYLQEGRSLAGPDLVGFADAYAEPIFRSRIPSDFGVGPLELQPWQKAILTSTQRRVVLMPGRSGGRQMRVMLEYFRETQAAIMARIRDRDAEAAENGMGC